MHARAAFGFLALSIMGASACASGGGGHGVTLDPSSELDAGVDAGDVSGDGDGDAPALPDGGGLPPPPAHDPNDVDQDGARGGIDCNDRDPSVYPAWGEHAAAPELCDGKDNDCDGFADNFAIDATTYYPDEDMDGLGNTLTPVRACQQPVGWVVDFGDCDDTDPNVGVEDLCGMNERPVIYVSLAGNDDNSGEAPMQAVRTIKVGIARALACPEVACSVLIAAGTYEESVAIADGVSLFGGYKPDFTVRDETQYEVIITSDQERTVTASGLTIPTFFDRITVHGAILAGDDGRSSYAVWVRDTADKLTLSHVHIVAGKGANGSKGADGQPTQCDAARRARW